MKLLRWFVISTLFMAAAPLAAQDWKGMGRMEGRVLDPDGKPLADIVVKLDLPSRGGGTTVKTDKKGRWALAGIAAGQWNVDIEAAGFEPRKLQVTLPGETARIPPVEIKLAKAVPKGPSPELLAAVEKGDAAYKAGKYAEARAEYEKVLTLKPELASTLHELIARCYSQEGNYAKSLEHLQHLLDAEPANTNLRVLMAQEALRGNMLDKGMELLKGIDEATITNPEIFYNIGVIFVNNQKAEEAIGYFTKAVTADPKYVDGYFQRGLAYLQLQKMAECKADFRKVLELIPEPDPSACKTECETKCKTEAKSVECKTKCESSCGDPKRATAKKALEQLK